MLKVRQFVDTLAQLFDESDLYTTLPDGTPLPTGVGYLLNGFVYVPDFTRKRPDNLEAVWRWEG